MGKVELLATFFLGFCVCILVTEAEDEAKSFGETLRSDAVSGALKATALSAAMHGAFRFMRDVESDALKELINQVEFDKMTAVELEKVLKAAWMVQTVDKLYRYDYGCKMDNEQQEMTVSITVGTDVHLPQKWILDYFQYNNSVAALHNTF